MSDLTPDELARRRAYEMLSRNNGLEPITTRAQDEEFLDRTVGKSNELDDRVKSMDTFYDTANNMLTDTPGKRWGLNPEGFNHIDAGSKAAASVRDPHRTNREGVRIGVGLTNKQLDDRDREARVRARALKMLRGGDR